MSEPWETPDRHGFTQWTWEFKMLHCREGGHLWREGIEEKPPPLHFALCPTAIIMVIMVIPPWWVLHSVKAVSQAWNYWHMWLNHSWLGRWGHCSAHYILFSSTQSKLWQSKIIVDFAKCTLGGQNYPRWKSASYRDASFSVTKEQKH